MTSAPTRSTSRHRRGGGVVGPDAGEAPVAPGETPISSTVTSSGAGLSSIPTNRCSTDQKSGAINPDDAAFVDLFTSPHRKSRGEEIHKCRVIRIDGSAFLIDTAPVGWGARYGSPRCW